MAINIENYTRKPFTVQAVEVTAENMEEVAKWCDGKIKTSPNGDRYIDVRVHRPMHPRQKKAFAGDRVLFAGSDYKIYTPRAFEATFEKASDEATV